MNLQFSILALAMMLSTLIVMMISNFKITLRHHSKACERSTTSSMPLDLLVALWQSCAHLIPSLMELRRGRTSLLDTRRDQAKQLYMSLMYTCAYPPSTGSLVVQSNGGLPMLHNFLICPVSLETFCPSLASYQQISHS